MTVNPDGSEDYSVSLQILAVMTAITLLPSFLLVMTSFCKNNYRFCYIKTSPWFATNSFKSDSPWLGTFFLTIFIMRPVFEDINSNAIQPYINEEISSLDALNEAKNPIHKFMRAQTRESDLDMFVRISDSEPVSDISDLSLYSCTCFFD